MPNTENSIRRKGVAQFLQQVLSEFVVGTLDPDLKGAKPDRYIENLMSNRLGDWEGRYVIGALCGEELVGILLALPAHANTYHIFSVHTKPTYRNQKIGRSMLLQCAHDMNERGIKTLLLDVHPENLPAIHLYTELGFQPCH